MKCINDRIRLVVLLGPLSIVTTGDDSFADVRSIYWTEEAFAGGVFRSTVQPPSTDPVLLDRQLPWDIEFDGFNGLLFWSETGGVFHSSLDGSGAETIPIPDLQRPVGLALELAGTTSIPTVTGRRTYFQVLMGTRTCG